MTKGETKELIEANNNLFKDLMEKVGSSLGLNVDFLADGELVRFYNDSECYEMINYDIGLNTRLSHMKATDKSMGFSYLESNLVPSIEHFLLKNPLTSDIEESEITAVIDSVVYNYGFPLIVKPNNGGGGADVTLVENKKELREAVSLLFSKRVEVTLSPFYPFITEYRCTVLDNKVLMSYGKVKASDQLQHNLANGATVVDVPSNLIDTIHNLAIEASKAIGIRFSNVDIVETPTGLRVLEINSGIALKRVIRNSVERTQLAKNVYIQAIKKLKEEI